MILITGANGSLGSEFRGISMGSKQQFMLVSSTDLDITKVEKVNALFAKHQFSACVNCAAYTHVDRAENEKEQAYAVNVQGAINLAKACEKHNVVLMQLSTDFVFDGKASLPYTECSKTNPINVYGRTKALAEQAILRLHPKSFIVRTSWLYATSGHNFVQTMLRLASQEKEISVVCDQTGSPTHAEDLAQVILKMLDHVNPIYGIYHFCNAGAVSWHGFATEIFRLKGLQVCLKPIPSAAYFSAAARPSYSVLDTSKIQKNFGVNSMPWKEKLEMMLLRLY